MEKEGRARRHKRITKKLRGTSFQPRLVVFRSKKHIYGQLVDDQAGKTLLTVSSLTRQIREKGIKNKKEIAKEVGRLLAQESVKKGFKNVCFDRAGYRYRGRVKLLAEGAREGGLKF